MAKVSQWFKWLGAAFAAAVLAIWHFGTKRDTRKLVEAEQELTEARETHAEAEVKHEEAMDDIREKAKRQDAESLKEDALAWARRKKQGF